MPKHCEFMTSNSKRCTQNAKYGLDWVLKMCKEHMSSGMKYFYCKKRCVFIDYDGTPCKASAQGKTDKCKKHGGGKRCVFIEEDGTLCKSGAEGKTDKCKKHGGGKRCVCGKHSPTFGYTKGEPVCCAECKKSDMSNVVHNIADKILRNIYYHQYRIEYRKETHLLYISY